MNKRLEKILESKIHSEITYRSGKIQNNTPVDFMRKIKPEENDFNSRLIDNLLLEEILKEKEVEETLQFLNEINPKGK